MDINKGINLKHVLGYYSDAGKKYVTEVGFIITLLSQNLK